MYCSEEGSVQEKKGILEGKPYVVAMEDDKKTVLARV
jgi:hypothetical protein